MQACVYLGKYLVQATANMNFCSDLSGGCIGKLDK